MDGGKEGVQQLLRAAEAGDGAGVAQCLADSVPVDSKVSSVKVRISLSSNSTGMRNHHSVHRRTLPPFTSVLVEDLLDVFIFSLVLVPAWTPKMLCVPRRCATPPPPHSPLMLLRTAQRPYTNHA